MLRQLALLLLCACQREVAHVGSHVLTEASWRARVAASPSDAAREPARVVEDMLTEPALALEAQALGLSSSALIESWHTEFRSTVTMNDLTNEELFAMYHNQPQVPYLPRRAHALVALFKQPEQALALRKTLSHAPATFDAFFAAYNPLAARGATAHAGDAVISHNAGYAPAVVDAALAATPRDVLGPIRAPCTRFLGTCYYVLLVLTQHPESNSFESRKEEMREPAYAQRERNFVRDKIAAVVSRRVVVDSAALARLKR